MGVWGSHLSFVPAPRSRAGGRTAGDTTSAPSMAAQNPHCVPGANHAGHPPAATTSSRPKTTPRTTQGLLRVPFSEDALQPPQGTPAHRRPACCPQITLPHPCNAPRWVGVCKAFPNSVPQEKDAGGPEAAEGNREEGNPWEQQCERRWGAEGERSWRPGALE